MILLIIFVSIVDIALIDSFDGPSIVFGVCGDDAVAPACAPAPSGQRYMPQDSLTSDAPHCRLYPCGVLVPSAPACPAVDCAPLSPPCRYRPNDGVNISSGCPLFPCGTVDCDCVSTPLCAALPHVSCQLHHTDDLDMFGCPLFPCGVAVCPPSSRSLICPPPTTPTPCPTACTAEQHSAKSSTGCDLFPCCDLQCPVCQNGSMVACPRAQADLRDQSGCRVHPCCLELAPCRRFECRDPPIVCSDADRTETYPIDCLVRPCCVNAAPAPSAPLQCPQAGCAAFRRCTPQERAAVDAVGCPINHCCEPPPDCEQRHGTCSQPTVCSPDRLARVDADGCRLEPCCVAALPGDCAIRQHCAPRIGCKLEAFDECKNTTSDCVRRCDTPRSLDCEPRCVPDEPFCECGCGLYRCEWRAMFHFQLDREAPFTERALFRKLIALSDPLVDIEIQFQSNQTVIVNLTLSAVEFSNQQPMSFANFRSQHFKLFQSIEFTSNWTEIEIEPVVRSSIANDRSQPPSPLLLLLLIFIFLISQ